MYFSHHFKKCVLFKMLDVSPYYRKLFLFALYVLQTDSHLTPSAYASVNSVSIGTGNGLSPVRRQDTI